MLILMRRLDEELIIGGNIKIKIVKIQGNQVHLGIEAPREITIYRNEIYKEMLLKEAAKAAEPTAKAIAKQKDKHGNR